MTSKNLQDHFKSYCSIPPYFRHTVTITKAFQTSWIVGNLSVVFWAYFFRDVFKLQMVLMSPLILTLIPVYLAKESPRWLIAKGYISQASKQIRGMACTNGRNADLTLAPSTSDEAASQRSVPNQTSFKDLFAPKGICLRTLNLFSQVKIL